LTIRVAAKTRKNIIGSLPVAIISDSGRRDQNTVNNVPTMKTLPMTVSSTRFEKKGASDLSDSSVKK
jgi:hypothetical protein